MTSSLVGSEMCIRDRDMWASVKNDMDIRDRWAGIRRMKKEYCPLPYSGRAADGTHIGFRETAQSAAQHLSEN
eukprot:8584525-Prorocentrum_lima.AAC.1